MSNINGSKSSTELQLDVIYQIIEAGCVVTVGEHEIRLVPPARSTIAHLHKTPNEGDNLTPEENERLSMYNMSGESVKACIPGLDIDGAFRLVALSGGEFGELAEKAMHLCGLKFVYDFARSKVDEAMHDPMTLTEAADEGGRLDPTIV